jgi:hypothetical protein
MNKQEPHQKKLYKKMIGYTLSPSCDSKSPDYVGACDYFKLDTIDTIEYYTPNDEDWGAIVAVSHEHELATNTGFYDMSDMETIGSEYAQVIDDGVIKCSFEV